MSGQSVMAHILLRAGMGVAVVRGGVKADHGERASGNDKAEQVGDAVVHGWLRRQADDAAIAGNAQQLPANCHNLSQCR